MEDFAGELLKQNAQLIALLTKTVTLLENKYGASPVSDFPPVYSSMEDNELEASAEIPDYFTLVQSGDDIADAAITDDEVEDVIVID